MTTLLDYTDRLIRDTEVDRKARQTHSGQAHWAGSGPSGASCRGCEHFAWKVTGGWHSLNGKHAGAPKPAQCSQFRKMTGRAGDSIPHDAQACKYFAATKTPQPLRRPE